MIISISKKPVGFQFLRCLTSVLNPFNAVPGLAGVLEDLLTSASVLHGGEGQADFTSDIRPCCVLLLLKIPSPGEVGDINNALPPFISPLMIN